MQHATVHATCNSTWCVGYMCLQAISSLYSMCDPNLSKGPFWYSHRVGLLQGFFLCVMIRGWAAVITSYCGERRGGEKRRGWEGEKNKEGGWSTRWTRADPNVFTFVCSRSERLPCLETCFRSFRFEHSARETLLSGFVQLFFSFSDYNCNIIC